MTSAGHSTALIRTLSYFSPTAAVAEQVSGIPQYRLLEELTGDFENRKEELCGNLRELAVCVHTNIYMCLVHLPLNMSFL